MPNFTSTLWPPIAYPSPEPDGPIVVAPAPVQPPMALPVVTAEVVLAVAPRAPNATAYRSPVTTQQGIYNVFRIIDGRLATQTP